MKHYSLETEYLSWLASKFMSTSTMTLNQVYRKILKQVLTIVIAIITHPCTCYDWVLWIGHCCYMLDQCPGCV